MAVFEYQAEDGRGELLVGHLTSVDEESARRELESRGLDVLNLLWCPAVDETGTLHDEELFMLAGAVGGAAANRLPLEIALAALAEETGDRRLAETAQKFALKLQQGATMAEAVAGLGQRLPAEVGGLLQAGVESGDLAGATEQLAAQRIISQRTRRRINTAIAYPLVILGILAPLLLFLSVFVIPEFGRIYEEFDLTLPIMTEVLLRVAKELPMIIGGLLAIVLLLPIVLRVVGGRWLFHRVRAALPLLGPLWTWGGQREFAAVLAAFLRLRIPMTDALLFTSNSLSDRNVAYACRRAAKRLEAGETLSSGLGQSIHFDRSLVALVTWGERHGLLQDALHIASTLFDDQIDQYATLIKRILPPITMLSVACLMFFVLVGLMVPLISLIEYLSR